MIRLFIKWEIFKFVVKAVFWIGFFLLVWHYA